MSITKFVVIQCDVQSCGYKTPMLEDSGNSLTAISLEEEMRSDQGFAFVEVPFKDSAHKYICSKCLKEIFGAE